jgi:Na+/proline symporter
LLLETGVVSVVAFVVVGVCVYVCASGAGSEAYTERLDASSTSIAVVAVAVMLAAPKGGWPFPFGGKFWQLVHRQFAPQWTLFWKHSQYFLRQKDLRHLQPHLLTRCGIGAA